MPTTLFSQYFRGSLIDSEIDFKPAKWITASIDLLNFSIQLIYPIFTEFTQINYFLTNRCKFVSISKKINDGFDTSIKLLE